MQLTECRLHVFQHCVCTVYICVAAKSLTVEHSAYSELVSVSPPGDCWQSFCRTDGSKMPIFFVLNLGPLFHSTVSTGTFLKVIQLCGHLPSTERRKWRPRTINGKSPVDLQMHPWKNLAPSGGKVLRKSRNFLQPFCRAPDLRKLAQTERQNSTLEIIAKKSKLFPPILSTYKNFPQQNFDSTSMPVSTVDSKSLSEIEFTILRKVEKSKFALSPMDRADLVDT